MQVLKSIPVMGTLCVAALGAFADDYPPCHTATRQRTSNAHAATPVEEKTEIERPDSRPH